MELNHCKWELTLELVGKFKLLAMLDRVDNIYLMIHILNPLSGVRHIISSTVDFYRRFFILIHSVDLPAQGHL